jgi:pimeloyl-ACP methyl ester carboxylesterase
VTLLGESMGAVLALTTAADLPGRVHRVVAVNPYDYAGGIARSGLLARLIVTGVLAPGAGPVLAGLEPRPILRAVLSGGVVDTTALRADYLDELLKVGRRPGYPAVARAVYANLPSLVAACSATPKSAHRSTSSTERRTGPGHQTGRPTGSYSPPPDSLRCRTPGTSSPWKDPTCQPAC